MKTNAEKIMKYCAFQERSILEVRRKMAELKMPENEADELLQELIEMNFVNDERFAECFIRGKVNIKKWGRVKIRIELQHHGVASSIISEKMNDIDDELYFNNLRYWIERWKRENPTGEKAKMFRFLMMKGYLADEIYQCASNQDEP